MEGLYIHIPFCEHICPYCDFYKMVASKKLKDAYLDAMLQEARLKKFENKEFKTIYIGGGTPSSIDPNSLDKFLQKLLGIINMKNVTEFTFEINPEHLTKELLEVLKKYHVNRLSIGVQSFDKEIQKRINRIYDFDEFKHKIAMINELGFTNYSFDLMYGFYNDKIERVYHDLDLLISLKPTHISTYALIVEEHTIFNKLRDDGMMLEASDEEEANIYYQIIDKLEENGYNQYETSNFSKPGYESKHNLIYWNDEDFDSLGAGATSFVSSVRKKTLPKIKEYIDSLNKGNLPSVETEVLELEELKDEYLMMTLRKTEGLSFLAYKERFNSLFEDDYPNYKSLIKLNLLKETTNGITIPKEHRFIANYVIVKLIS